MSGYDQFEDRIHVAPREPDLTARFFEDNFEDYAHELTSEFWNTKAQLTLRNHLLREQNKGIAKNVIFFLGDEMSMSTVAAARIYSGQLNDKNGEESQLSFEKFPYIGLSKVKFIKYVYLFLFG